MATRYYLEASAASPEVNPSITPAYDAAWDITTAAARRWMTTSAYRLNTALAQTGNISESSATADIDVLCRQFISPALAAQTIDGTLKGQIRVLVDTGAAADFRAQVVARVVSADGTTVRGTLLAADTSALSSEFPTSAYTNRKFPLAASSPATLTSVDAQDGDHIVVEIGYRSHNSTATQHNAYFRFGSNAASDLPEDETDTNEYNPWVEFSGTLTELQQTLLVTSMAAEYAAQDTATERRVTTIAAELSSQDTTPEHRITTIAAELLLLRQEDYAYWGEPLMDEGISLD